MEGQTALRLFAFPYLLNLFFYRLLAMARSCTILMADDDADDCLLVREALVESGRNYDLRVVRNGEELLDYLRRRGPYAASGAAPRPDLILLDLKMPKKDGRESLRELKGDVQLMQIPVVMLTTSTDKEDIAFAYKAGVNSYVTKPVSFRALVDLMDTLGKYWLETVEPPCRE
jgi:CheY-like chemotaxis protein